ncbi:type II toxin-antitoxin system RelE family toxin [Streptomyces oceani]|uniref:Plasmid stabilization protein n=1 Tax=Streptomyces oceani TaxID=1075402 RepID=A0A1E7KME5_9ACTN|nr:type II toxin-antitoxin system RelE/ParE family toxin [Streptomyces oceani]OEV05080.1 plasmid stabilization protein [Streptomyces oceani]
MSYDVAWRPAARSAVARFHKSDPDGVNQVLDSVNLLAREPRPHGATKYGSDEIFRVHVGRYRLMYEVRDALVTVIVVHVGRIP